MIDMIENFKPSLQNCRQSKQSVDAFLCNLKTTTYKNPEIS